MYVHVCMYVCTYVQKFKAIFHAYTQLFGHTCSHIQFCKLLLAYKCVFLFNNGFDIADTAIV